MHKIGELVFTYYQVVMDSSFACVVEFGSREGASCSAIILDAQQGYVVSHASLLLPYIYCKPKDETLYKKITTQALLCNTDIPQHGVKVIITEPNKHVSQISNNTSGNSLPYENKKHKGAASALRQYAGNIVCVWKAEAFSEVLNKLMPKYDGWSFSSDSADTAKEGEHPHGDYMFPFLSYFVLIKVDGGFGFDLRTTEYLIKNRRVRQADPINIVATPFAILNPTVFMNSISEGIVSKLSGANNELILTDARCLPGSEGGAVIMRRKKGRKPLLIGMVVTPVCLKANEWTGLSVCCGMDTILHSLQLYCSKMHLKDVLQISVPSHIRSTLPGRFHDYLKCVVLVTCMNTWGSGFVIDPQQGLILTCSHVVKFSKLHTVCVTFGASMNQHSCTVIYTAGSGDVYDIALLKLDTEKQTRICPQITVAPPVEGETVYCVGHALFSERIHTGPSISRGVVSKVVSIQHKPIMIQTTCAVNAGISGGPLINEHGDILGVIVNNAKDTDSDADFPHLNMIIPIMPVWEVIELYRKSQDSRILSKLCVNNGVTKAIWQLDSSVFEIPVSKL